MDEREHGVRPAFIAALGALLTVLVVFVAPATPAHAAAPLHGLSFLTGCDNGVRVGEKTRCDFLVANIAHDDIVTVTSFSEVWRAAGGPDWSGNLLAQARLTFTGGSSCDAGQNICTLPPESRIATARPVLFHTVTSADAENRNPLTGTATLVWQDLCSSEVPGCPLGDRLEHGTLFSVIAKRPSSVDSAIHDKHHNEVSAVVAGTKVHDAVTVTGGTGAPTPTGKVNVDFFTNGECSGDPESNSGDANLVDGKADLVRFDHKVRGGSYGFIAHYTGSPAFGSSDGNCESLVVVDAATARFSRNVARR
jgi:hypothetical protein